MGDKKCILIVDDEPDVIKWLTVLFTENGYDTEAAYDGLEGFEKAVARVPDLITLDVSMPRDSGIKMYDKLLKDETTKHIPVIMVTAAPPQLGVFLDRMKTKKAPAAFLEKPVNEQELLQKIKDLI
ncbi:MAG: response regulator [bacterium]